MQTWIVSDASPAPDDRHQDKQYENGGSVWLMD